MTPNKIRPLFRKVKRVRQVDMYDYEFEKQFFTDYIQLSMERHKETDKKKFVCVLSNLALTDEGEEHFINSAKKHDADLKKIHCVHPELRDVLLPIFEYGVNEHPVIVYDYVDGQPLYTYLSQQPRQRVSLPVALVWLQELSTLLGAIHKGGKYLNVNPNNILVKPNNKLCALYFVNNFVNNEDSHIEAVRFLAPENVDEALGTPGPASDQYSVAYLFYWFITGEPLFQGEHIGVIVPKHRNNRPNLSKVPRMLRSVLRKALAKRPQDRYMTIEQFCEALMRAYQLMIFYRLSIVFVGSRVTGKVDVNRSAGRRIARRKLLVGGVATVAAIGLVVATAVVDEALRNNWFRQLLPAIRGPNKQVPSRPQSYELVHYYTHDAIVNNVHFSSNSEWLASCDAAGIIKVSNMKNMQSYTLPVPRHQDHPIIALVWSPGSYTDTYLATMGDNGWLYIRTLQGNTIAQNRFNGDSFALAWSAQHLLVGVDNIVRVYDDPVKDGFNNPDHLYTFNDATINSIAFVPSKTDLVATVNANGVLQLWYAEHGEWKPLSTSSKEVGGVADVSASPDGKYLVTVGTEGNMILWFTTPNTDMGSILKTYNVGSGVLNTVSFAKDSQRFAVGGENANVSIFNLSGQSLSQFKMSGPVQSVTFSSDGQLLVAGGGNDVQIRRAF